jgi:tetratricopeptide (TPR) repeat protein
MAYRLRGDYEGDIADYDRCIQDCTYAINKAPTYGASFFNREMCYFAKQEYEEALADCNRLIELNFQNAAVYYERGRVYKAQGERDKAIADFEEVLEISQDSNLRTWAERQLQALGVQ